VRKPITGSADRIGVVRFYAAGLLDPAQGYLSKLIILIGLAYPFGPIDIIPNRIPVIGYFDQIVFVVGSIALSYLAMPRPGTHETAARPGTHGKTARPGTMRMARAQRVRAALLDGFAMMLATPILRLATGRWPAPADTAMFRRSFRHFTPLPPLMRGLASVPAGREQLTRAMLAGWLLADSGYQGRLVGEMTEDDARPGNALRVWSGPPVTFLHLEKTAGMSVVAALAAQFHPLQIDADLRRAFPPHVLCPLPPFLLPRVRRCALVWGHYDLPSIRRLGPGRFTFTLLRAPEARIVSLYRYWRGQAALDLGWNGMNAPVLAAQRLSLADFLATDDPIIRDYIDNFYVRRLTGQYISHNDADPLEADPQYWLDQALAALDTLDFVGLTEDSDGALAVLGERLDFAAPARAPRVNVTASVREEPFAQSGEGVGAAGLGAASLEGASLEGASLEGASLDTASLGATGACETGVREALLRLTRLDRHVYAAAARRYDAAHRGKRPGRN